MTIGILALQGDFSLHSKILNKLDVNNILVRKKEDFDINISGKLEGIGAILVEEDGHIKIVDIVPGSASSRQG